MTDECMKPIPFIQFLRPNGKRVGTNIMRPMEVATKAYAIAKAGFRFESEMLTTGNVAFAISDEDDDYAVEICPNGPEVLAAVDKLIMDFDIEATVRSRDADKALDEFLDDQP